MEEKRNCRKRKVGRNKKLQKEKKLEEKRNCRKRKSWKKREIVEREKVG